MFDTINLLCSCMAMADAGFAKYKLTSTEQKVAMACADVRAADTAIGTIAGVS